MNYFNQTELLIPDSGFYTIPFENRNKVGCVALLYHARDLPHLGCAYNLLSERMGVCFLSSIFS